MGLGLWLALVLLFASQFVLVGSFSWKESLSQAFAFWGLWVILMPLVVLLSFWLPIERNRLIKTVGIHILACMLVVTVGQIAYRKFIPIPPPGGPGEGNGSQATESSQFRRPERPPPQGFLAVRAGLDILVYWSLFGVCQGITNFRSSQQRERRAAELEARLTRSKLQALRMQINPHFLFNTLNAISTLIYVNPRAADEMLGDLSELLRRCLDSMEEQEIPLARELEFIRAYVGIEQKRFGDRLRMEQHVPDDLMQAVVPALILQPLVENAIRHGIEPQRAPGLVTIEARRDGNRLHLIVTDDGKGPPAGDAGLTKRGIGLSNTQARLKELYGPLQEFSFAKRSPRGCVVHIQLPLHDEPQPMTPPPADR